MRFIEIYTTDNKNFSQILNLDHVIRIVPQHSGGAIISLPDKQIVITQSAYEKLYNSLGAFKI